jgi:hypothetical protein
MTSSEKYGYRGGTSFSRRNEMTGLESTQNTIEELYQEIVFNKDTPLDDEDGCECGRCDNCKVTLLLKERIKTNLRTVLCDLMIMRLFRDDTLLELH